MKFYEKEQRDRQRLKGSRDSTHYLERDELWGLRRLPRSGAYVFVNERGDPFKRERIARLIQRAGEAAKLPFPSLPCP